MNKEIIGKYCIINGEKAITDNDIIYNLLKKSPIYEVFTVEESCPMFVKEHFERLKQTAASLNETIDLDENELLKNMKKLIELNLIKRSNLKLLVTTIDDQKLYVIYEMKAKYPDESLKQEGIEAIFYNFDRHNPNIKVHLNKFKKDVGKAIDEAGAFEAVLVNSQGYLTEGSRTNCYFIKGGKVITAPDEMVLKGITRSLVLKMLDDIGVETEFRLIKKSEYKELDGMFFSGTTIDIMPVRKLAEKIYDTQNLGLMKKLIKYYDDAKKEYILEHRND